MAETTTVDPFAGLPGIFREAATDGRKGFETPWVEGGFVYASDTRIMVRMSVETPREEWAIADRKFPKKGENIFAASAPWRTDPTPMPDCPGNGMEECETCRGLAVVTCNYDHEHECPSCENGQVANLDRVAVGDFYFTYYLLAKLQRHGVNELFLKANDPKAKYPARFGVGDVEGLIMPLRPNAG